MTVRTFRTAFRRRPKQPAAQSLFNRSKGERAPYQRMLWNPSMSGWLRRRDLPWVGLLLWGSLLRPVCVCLVACLDPISMATYVQ